MGRKTYESLGRPLDGRQNIVVTRNKEFEALGCKVVHSIGEALGVARGDEIMIIGGAQLYEQLLPLAHRLYLTEIEANFVGDTTFPIIAEEMWLEVSRRTYEPDESSPYRFHHVVMERLILTPGKD